MKKNFLEVVGIVICSLLLAVPLSAQDQSSKKAASSEKTTSSEKTAPSTKAMKSKPETLTGSIMSVDSAKKMVVIKGSDGVPYDVIVNRSTRIESGGKKVKLDDLQSDTGKQVSVRILPERSGNIAQSIQVTG